MKQIFQELENFMEAVEPLTSEYKEGHLGRIIYSAMLGLEKGDGRIGFRPPDLWQVSDEDLIKLLKKLEDSIRSRSENS